MYVNESKSRNEMFNHVSTLIRQAITTFTCKSEAFVSNLEVLKQLLNQTTATDINLNPGYMSETLWKMKGKAPVSYIKIFDNSLISVGVFLLKPGMRLPLHDHPQMYGLIKVLSGTVQVTSYSVVYDSMDKYDPVDNLYPPLITVECASKEIINSASECCVLEPTRGNLHEIESVDGAAAFLDILSPPYETDIPNIGPRKCSYFKILEQIASKKYILEETPPPSWYWSDVLPYSGPELQL